MSRTPALYDKAMWRKLLSRAHPDAGGDHDLFIWAVATRDAVCDGSVRQEHAAPPRRERRAGAEDADRERVPYPEWTDFREATRSALEQAATRSDGYGRLLALLDDCCPLSLMWRQEQRGASYKQLAFIAHLVGMDAKTRSGWYRVAESIPLSDRHAGHIIKRLKGERP